jgi:hypothetical protein
MNRPTAVALLLALGGAAWGLPIRQATARAQPAAATQWYKGNTHTHTLNSDGDSTPDDVVRWYREHGYRFLVLSDHNYLTSVDGLNAVHGADEQFLVIKGEEVSDRLENTPLHINGLEYPARSTRSTAAPLWTSSSAMSTRSGRPAACRR